jgi:hypothetical protein
VSLGGLVFVVAFSAVWVLASGGAWWGWLAALAFGALQLRRTAGPLLRPKASPFVVDAPGVWVGDDAVRENEERLVHWETIAAVVLFRAAAPGSRDLHDAVGLRLRRHPDVVAIRRVLDSWSLDRARLEAAVARFAPGVPVVDGPDDLGATASAARTVGAVADELTRAAGQANEARDEARVAESLLNHEQAAAGFGPGRDGGPDAPGDGSGWQFVPVHRVRYRATDPRAYVVRPTWRGSPVAYVFLVVGVVVGVLVGGDGGAAMGLLFGAMFTLPFTLHAAAVLRGSVRFAVDAPGVFFGEAQRGERPADHRLVPWADMASVVLFDVELEKSWERAVGVTRVPPGGGEPELEYHRVVDGWRLDRAALEAAVLSLAPQVPVVDGPPVPRPRLRDVAGAALDEWHRRRGPQR